MNKKAVALFLALSLLFIAAACGQTEKKAGGTFSGGSDGILISFKETAPVSEFQQKDSVPVTATLKNKGEFDLNSGEAKAKLFGLNLDNFGLSTAKTYKGSTGALKGVSSINPEGSEQEIGFGDLKYKLDMSGNEISYTLKAKVCYPYQTKTLTQVCMRSKQLETVDTTTCSLGKEKIVSGDVSSAPVQITSIMEETRGSDQVKFSVKIENKGGGKIYALGSNCDELDKDVIKAQDKENKVTYEVANPTDIKCGSSESSRGEVTLANNQYTLTCWKTLSDVHVDTLNIKLSYVYVSETSKAIKIFKTL